MKHPFTFQKLQTRVAVGVVLAGLVACEAPDTAIEGSTQAITGSNPYSQSFTAFESGQVRPLALTPDKKFLLATNTPDAKVEIFRVKNSGLEYVTSVPVGLEPVAVSARTNDEAWVVNHLSDSVSIIKLDGKKSHVSQTLLVGDEPRDVVFGGHNKSRAFITTAHRGQNSPVDPALETPGVGRADVWVFDANNCHEHEDGSMGGEPLNILSFFSEMPRALAVTPDGSKVYAAAYFSGNATASTPLFNAIANPLPPLQLSTTPPLIGAPVGVNAFGEDQPTTSVIVKYDGEHWRDEYGGIRDNDMLFTMPDKDVFAIDANANPPQEITGPTGVFSGVGTTLFNMIVNPANGKVYVSNLDANNQQRFEGANNFAGPMVAPKPSVRGHLAESRITVLDDHTGSVTPRHLNKHINYDVCCDANPDENAKSVAFPIGMEITSNGQTLYVAAVGSSEVAVYNTAQLENNTFTPNTADQIHVSGGGPTGLALDESKSRLYVLTRFDNSIKIINTQTKAEIGSAAMYNPEPAHIVNGRRFLYDASFSSSHGDSACFSCHVFADWDRLGWDLGDPDQQNVPNPNPFRNNAFPFRKVLHSNKGIMTTQSLRGMDNMGPMHWRGDRTGADINHPELNVQPDGGAYNERAAFMAFNVAFPGLLGRDSQIPTADMEAFTTFILEVMYPPNPIRNLDNSLNEKQQDGADMFLNRKLFFDPNPLGTPFTEKCTFCHALDRNANAGLTTKPGFFGSNSLTSEVGANVLTKNPHFRNLYQKVGKFNPVPNPAILFGPETGQFQGEQISGWGFIHDGTIDTMTNFHRVPGFSNGDVLTPFPPFAFMLSFLPGPTNPEGFPDPMTPQGIYEREAVSEFLLAFDSNFAPIVGQQVTLSEDNEAGANDRVDLLLARANADECQLIARDKNNEGFLWDGSVFLRNKSGKPALSDAQLRDRAEDGSVTYTCVPKGNGRRLSIDRDLDGILDGNE